MLRKGINTRDSCPEESSKVKLQGTLIFSRLNSGISCGKRDTLHVIEVPLLQSYTQIITISNNLGARVDAEIRPGSRDKYTVNPSKFTLKQGQSLAVKIVLKLLKFAAKRNVLEQTHKDFFHIKVRSCLVNALKSMLLLHHFASWASSATLF